MSSSPRSEKVTAQNVDAACELRLRPGQEDFVAPVVRSLADAYAHGEVAWPRVIVDADRVVGFVMGGFDPRSPVDAFRCGIWRLNIAADEQGRGYGRFAVEAVRSEARRRGERRMTVLWLPGEQGPERFYRRMGFHPTGEEMGGQVVGELMV